MMNMGGLRKTMPVTYITFLIGGLSLAGLPLITAGFWSKDEILADSWLAGLFDNKLGGYIAFGLLLAAAFFTAFYMWRQMELVFFGKPRTPAAEHAKESPPVITIPLVVLALLSVLGGLLNFPGSHTLGHWLEHTFHTVEEGHFVWAIAGGSLAVALLGIFIAWLIYGRKPQTSPKAHDPLEAPLGGLFQGMARKWWVDEVYQAVIIRPFEVFADFLTHPVDLGVIDGIGNGLGSLTRAFSSLWGRLQTGFVRTYALTILLGVVTVLGYITYLALR